MIPLFKVAMSRAAPKAVKKVLDSGYIGQGPVVEEFEEALQRELRLPHRPLAVNSGTSALDLAYHLCGVGPGDIVLSTPMTCMASNTPLLNRGAQILWADVDRLTGLIDPQSVAKLVASVPRHKLKAIVAVDWGGRLCDYQALKRHGIPVVQDAAHAYLSAGPNGEPIHEVGGDLICWSFQAIKALTTADGGALFVSKAQHERAKLLRWFGLDRTQNAMFRCNQRVWEAGYKYQMNDVAAAIGLSNIAQAAINVHQTQANAARLLSLLDEYVVPVPMPDAIAQARRADSSKHKVVIPQFAGGSSYWLLTLIVNDRPSFMEHMTAHGVTTSPVHARNDHMPAFMRESDPTDLPGVDFFSEYEVCVPIGHWLIDGDVQRVAADVIDWAQEE